MGDRTGMKWCTLKCGCELYEVFWDASEGRAVKVISGFEVTVRGMPLSRSEKPTGIQDIRWTVEELVKARHWLLEAIRARPLEPDAFQVGDRVCLVTGHRNERQVHLIEPCSKCAVTGQWANSDRLRDVRRCKICWGDGRVVACVESVRNSTGKQLHDSFPSGAAGTVVWLARYRGRLPARDNNQYVHIRTDDGRELRCPVKKLRLVGEPDGYGEVLKGAEAEADGMNPVPFLGFGNQGVEITENRARTFYEAMRDQTA